MHNNTRLQQNGGMTLIEVLIVVALFSFIASFGLLISMDTYNNSSFKNERDLFISVLMHARAQAMHNICITSTLACTSGKAHGVHMDTVDGILTDYVLFQGETYDMTDPANEVIETTHFIESNGANEIVFEQLSGTVTNPVIITLTGSENESSVVTISTEGQIYWTH